MPSLKIDVPHTLTQDEALARVQRLLTQVKSQYAEQIQQVDEQWEQFQGRFLLKVMGMKSEGTVRIEEAAVRIDSKIPLAAWVMKGQIETAIRTHLGKLLS